MKVEEERGLSFDTYEEDGQIRVEVVLEDGLVFTSKTQVFKAAVFYMDGDDLVGLITDDQTGSVYRGPVSHYWLTDFLRIRCGRDADVQTRSWIKATQRVIRSDIESPADKNSVFSAMIGELASNRNAIDPRRFISDHVPPDVQDKATQRLHDEGTPTTRFPRATWPPPDLARKRSSLTAASL